MPAIECKLIREGGTFASIGTTEYHFAPQDDGAHVANVEDDEHVDRFLSISDGYRMYRGASKPVHVETKVEAQAAPEAVVEPVQDEPASVDERAELVAHYTALYYKAPRANASIDKLRELIAAKQ